MTKHREGFNPPGLKTWRRTSLAAIGKLSANDIERQETAYIAWLAEAYGVRTIVAEAHARSQRSGELLSSQVETVEHDREERLSDTCVIRTVRCWSTKAKEHFNGVRWQRFDGNPFVENSLTKSDAPTHYRVEMNGRPVNSFHSITRARSWALAQIAA